MMNLDEAKAFFENDRFAMSTAGIDIISVEKDYAKCAMNIDERHVNAKGMVMGGAIYTLADFTFAVATNCGDQPTVTLVAQISYLNVAKGKTLFGESHLIKNGRRNCFYEITVTDELGTDVASVSITGAHV